MFFCIKAVQKPDYSAKIDDFASKSVRAKLSSSQTVLLNELAEKTERFRQIRISFETSDKICALYDFSKVFFFIIQTKNCFVAG